MLRVTVNGRPVECDKGATLLAAIRRAGADVPTLCDDPRLKPIGACRMCLVQIKGRPTPATACNTPAEDGMDVETATPDIEQLRKTMLQLLARQYPPEPVRRFPDKRFHEYLRKYGLEGELKGTADPALLDSSHPYIRVDMSQCIYCFRCVRICDEVQGQSVWRVWNRGDATRIRPDSGGLLADSSCVSCGACVDTCPTGALEDQSMFTGGERSTWTRTTCPYCGTGCEMEVGTSAGRVVAVRPVQDAPVNRGHLCVKGRYAFGFNDAPDRVTEPLLRDANRWKPVSWQEAIQFVADGLRRVLDRHGPDAIGVLGSARATNEENYLAQKFARVVLGTNNVDCCARVCHAPTAEGMKQVLGTGAATNSFDDIEQTSAILVCGANPTENHPIVGARIKQAALRGAPLIVIDPRRIELAHYAQVHLAPRPGTNIPLLNAIACTIVEEGLFDAQFVRDRVSDWDSFRRFIASWTPETVVDICGIAANLIRQAARIYATQKPAMCFHGLGVTEHGQGTEAVTCLVNLALLTGNLGKPGSGINPLRGQNNVQGAAQMGCEPRNLTGSAPLAKARDLFEKTWRVPLPTQPGLNLMRMMDAAAEGRFKALWAIGYDIALTNPNAAATRRALTSLELLVVQDLFLTQVAEHASVFLPAASPFEKEGTFMNSERRIQRVRSATPPRGNSKPDWQIICEVARAMGKGEHFAFHSPQEIWEEVRAVWPAGRGITYDRLDRGGLQWPCPAESHPGTSVLHTETFPVGPRAALRRVEFVPTPEQTTTEFPFLLTTGRTLYQFNAGTMTMRTPNALLRPEDYLEMSPADAGRLGVRDGERMRVSSRYGQAILPVRASSSIKPGELFSTFHTPGAFVNELTSDKRDRQVDTPEYKVTAVRVERV
jgi:formate dehydrogenase major subunit